MEAQAPLGCGNEAHKNRHLIASAALVWKRTFQGTQTQGVRLSENEIGYLVGD